MNGCLVSPSILSLVDTRSPGRITNQSDHPTSYSSNKEIQARLNSRTTSILRNSKSTTITSAPTPTSSSPSTSTTLNPLTPKDHQAYLKIQTEYTKLDTLQTEKETLATRLVSIITRHKERAREEYKKIGGDVSGLEKVEGEGEGEMKSLQGLAALVARYTGVEVGLGGAGSGGRGSLGPGGGGAGVDERATKSEFWVGLFGGLNGGRFFLVPTFG